MPAQSTAVLVVGQFKPQYRLIDVIDLGLTPRSRGNNSTLSNLIMAQTPALASVPAGETVILVLNELNGGVSDLSVWRVLAEALDIRILLAIVELLQCLCHELDTVKQLKFVNLVARIRDGWDVLSESKKLYVVFELNKQLHQASLTINQ